MTDWLLIQKKMKPSRQAVSHWITRAYETVLDSTARNSWRRAMDLSVEAEELEDEHEEHEEDDGKACDDFLILSPVLVGESCGLGVRVNFRFFPFVMDIAGVVDVR